MTLTASKGDPNPLRDDHVWLLRNRPKVISQGQVPARVEPIAPPGVGKMARLQAPCQAAPV